MLVQLRETGCFIYFYDYTGFEFRGKEMCIGAGSFRLRGIPAAYMRKIKSSGGQPLLLAISLYFLPFNFL